jgi:diaminobutyrate-2-oxoglutarate transaminase
MEKQTLKKGDLVERQLKEIAAEHAGTGASVRGRGLAWGLAFDDPDLTDAVCSAAFEGGLLVETAGAQGEVTKLMPALTTTEDELDAGLRILAAAVKTARAKAGKER